MTALFVIAIVALVLLVADRLRSGERVVVTTKQLQSYRGIRRPTLRPVVLLAEVELLGESVEPLGGRLAVPRRNVARVQELGERVRVVELPGLERGTPEPS